MRVSIYGTWQLRQINTLVFLHWSIKCFPCLRSILFSLGWSMFRTCFHPEDSFCLNKFCSSPTADVEAGVIVARMFSFLHLSVSLCRWSFFFFKKKNPQHSLHSILYGGRMTTTLAQFCFHIALWICIVIFTFLLFTLWLVQAFSLCKRTSLLAIQEAALPCHFISTEKMEYEWELAGKQCRRNVFV